MINAQDFLKDNYIGKKFEVDELLFVELICPVEADSAASHLWWHNNFFSYAMAGEMLLKTLSGEYVQKAGDCIFAKKGSMLSARHNIREDFCELRVFVPDAFIKTVFRKYGMSVRPTDDDRTDAVIPLPSNEVLEIYFHSLLTYFRQPAPPSESLLRLKFEELLVNLVSNDVHRPMTNFFKGLCASNKTSVREIMEANFFCKLSLEEFARLCGRSLSAFKREFKDIFQTTPGKWLQLKRLEYSRYLLETTNMSIDEIYMISGFENRSHFNRVFKSKYNLTPGRFNRQSKVYA
jgi:AraC-like DNA-binding protein